MDARKQSRWERTTGLFDRLDGHERCTCRTWAICSNSEYGPLVNANLSIEDIF